VTRVHAVRAAPGTLPGGLLDPDVAVLVLKLGRYRLHHGGLAVIRSFGRAGVAVYGVHEDRLAPAALSAHLTGGFVWATGHSVLSTEALVKGLREIVNVIPSRLIAVATDDLAAIALDEHRAALGAVILPHAARGLARQLADKQECQALAMDAGVPVVESTVVPCPSDPPDVPLPVVVKRRNRTLDDSGRWSFSTVIARSRAELGGLLRGDGVDPFEVLLQPFVEGDDWLYHGYLDSSSRPLVGFTARKLRSHPVLAGETSFARTESNSDVRAMIEGFLAHVGYAGPISADIRFDRSTATYRLLDVNPRIGACFRLFVTDRGIDVARAMHLDLSGREIPPGRQIDGRTYVVENYDLASSWSADRPVRAAAIRSACRRILRADERAWAARDDWLAALGGAIQATFREPSPSAALAEGGDGPRYFRGRAHHGRARRRRGGGSTWKSLH
jgi:D-aspartate ligase